MERYALSVFVVTSRMLLYGIVFLVVAVLIWDKLDYDVWDDPSEDSPLSTSVHEPIKLEGIR